MNCKRPSPVTNHAAWQVLLLVLLLSDFFAFGGVRPSVVASGGGGSTPVPPSVAPSAGGAALAGTNSGMLLPLLVAIDGPQSNYVVAVTESSGVLLAVGTTNQQGWVILQVPAGSGLELDVLGTDVIGLPVHAGQAVSITIP